MNSDEAGAGYEMLYSLAASSQNSVFSYVMKCLAKW